MERGDPLWCAPCCGPSGEGELGECDGREWECARSECSADAGGVSLLEAFEDFEVRVRRRSFASVSTALPFIGAHVTDMGAGGGAHDGVAGGD